MIKVPFSSLFDAFRMPFVNRRIVKKLESLDAQESFSDIKSLSEEDIEKYIESEWTRAKELDDKLSKLTAALSVALTVGGAVAKSIVDGLAASPIKWTIVALLFLSMVFFFYGAIIGFRGLRPKPRFGYGAKFMNAVASGGESARKSMNEAAAGFEVVNLIRANEASAAIDLIRNGIVLFAIAMALSFVAPGIEVSPRTATISTKGSAPAISKKQKAANGL
ncbi:hypothetical protein Nwi_2876 [Nitrobacter winogradskyi Nb-255]|uniref:Uncharacterized protein n=1 Tax=Nitrobacter winogradskyi (strain ATCC 25391 / DSM 10237 / CIP 104748 / NCIMB 11846 / Nb-255) TaxID=323098 RepID=Q3SNL5_NITWN|nr:hypothetical protein [Nitrobacter winogradskyi]ABA06126.1 hypothetical protein Nwi_2876 [Nitrobacter winogradskyi Nb-255]